MLKGSFEEVEEGTAEFFSTLAVWEVEQGMWTVEEVAYSKDYVPRYISDFTGDGTLDVFWTYKYLYCAYGLDAYCNLYIANCWYASTPCSESEHEVSPTVLDAASCLEPINTKIECSYFADCAELNSTEPYRYCTTYYGADGDIYWQGPCKCSSTPCSESEQDQMTAVLTSAISGRSAQHRLGASYPNPFNPQMIIPLDLATDEERVDLALYDVLGHRVRRLWQGPLGAGRHRFVWDGRNEEGKAVAAGVYIYKVEVDGQVEAKKTTKLP